MNKIEIEIPEDIISLCEEAGLNLTQIKHIFKCFLNEMMDDEYGQFHIDFDNWFTNMDDNELDFYLKYK